MFRQIFISMLALAFSLVIFSCEREKQNQPTESVADVEEAPSQYEHLKELEWMIGSWVDAEDDVDVKTESYWFRNKNFLIHQFIVNDEGRTDFEGEQFIGWDPEAEKIRSWLFDSDGGFGEGTWTKRGESWVVEVTQTLADGSRASATQIYKPVNATSYTWEATDREVDGELLPDIEPVTIVRKSGESQ